MKHHCVMKEGVGVKGGKGQVQPCQPCLTDSSTQAAVKIIFAKCVGFLHEAREPTGAIFGSSIPPQHLVVRLAGQGGSNPPPNQRRS